jgi:hypothetical protein
MIKTRIIVLFLVLLTACAASPTRIILEWTTATEINTAGFNIYRGDSQAGPFAQVNAQLIPASTDAVLGGKYKFEDTTVKPGQTYYYQLEDVEFGGKTERHGPIVITAPSTFGITEIAFIVVALLALGGFVLMRFNSRKSLVNSSS